MIESKQIHPQSGNTYISDEHLLALAAILIRLGYLYSFVRLGPMKGIILVPIGDKNIIHWQVEAMEWITGLKVAYESVSMFGQDYLAFKSTQS